jgi:signal transduction histidine kinase
MARIVAEIVALVRERGGAETPLDPLLEAALDRIADGLGAPAGAIWVQDRVGGPLTPRARRPPGLETPALPPPLVEAETGAGTRVALGLGWEGDARPTAAARAVVSDALQVVALAVGNRQLLAGLRDRARELDRQVVQLAALTAIAREVPAAPDEEADPAMIAGHARALTRADSARVEREGPEDTVLEPDRMAVPLAIGDATAAIVVARGGPPPFTPGDLGHLRALAEQAAAALAGTGTLTDLRNEQAERGALAAALVAAQEEERRRVAEDLHDGPVQELVGVGLLLDALATALGGDPERAEDAARAGAAAREAVRALRRAIADLHPLALDELGFAGAVRSLVERLEWGGVEVELDLAAASALEGAARTVAFRIVQEAVANVARHADARRVLVRARRDGDAIAIEVSDDGRGFDPSAARPPVAAGHLGLAAVRERAALAGGRLDIDSAEGRGTTVRLVLPAPQGD